MFDELDAVRTEQLPPLETMPLIVDTDVGGDPDDAVAIAVAAGLPELALVVTSDEIGGRRARLARHLLDLLGRADVAVVAGKDLGVAKYWAAAGLVPESVPVQDDDVVAAVARVFEGAQGPVRWLGIGPMSNLAAVIGRIPDAEERLVVTQMGGGLEYRHADRAEHNVRLDVDAARAVFRAGLRMWVMPSDVTFHPANEITSGSAEYVVLAGKAGVLIRAHMDQWFADFHPGTMQHDALALALAMGMPFVRFGRIGVDLDGIGRMTAGEHQVFLTNSADYAEFRTWLRQRLERLSGEGEL
ncbi:nucleoside hydrolase [Nocardia sp. NPDC051832]|uniref:nucleoside hydrolase n=1 Tax=Nocardia sp. NPDC051832 TaxID=3155673 RepID=UPI00343C5D62